MRSRAARWTLVAVAWVTLGAAAGFLFHSQKQIVVDTGSMRAIDLRAREATDALGELRAAQQAYVATGQGLTFWMPKVAATNDAVNNAFAALRQSATSPAAQAALNDATTTLAEFGAVDRRARDYIKSGQMLMAADVIFTEGGQAAATTSRQIDTARQAEHEAFEAEEAALRTQQVLAGGGAAMFAGLVLLLLAPAVRPIVAVETVRDAYKVLAATDDGIVSHARPTSAASVAAPAAPPPPAMRTAPVLKAAADLATDFGRVRDSDELARLLARAAEVIDASGLIVWMGGTSGEDLRPVLAHGYAPQVLAKMASVPRTADNAAGAAYRTGSLQIVLSRPGGLNGAIVAPILAADGCIGALSAEIRGGGEGSEGVQALVAIIAAHLANIVAAAPAEPGSEVKAAAASRT